MGRVAAMVQLCTDEFRARMFGRDGWGGDRPEFFPTLTLDKRPGSVRYPRPGGFNDLPKRYLYQGLKRGPACGERVLATSIMLGAWISV